LSGRLLRTMARVTFTKNLERHVACPAEDVEGATLGAALDAYFARHPKVRSYVLDEQSELRRHVVLFVDGRQVAERKGFSQGLRADSEVYVMQALSGG
jgi:molybdopterin synthase sulfur carrier subunit